MMHQRLTHYLTALMFLTASSVVYQNGITPWMRAPDVTPIPPKAVAVGTVNRESLAGLFPEDAWQCGTCKQLQTSRGMLLFRKWEQISDNQWKLWPVTVVIGRGMSADQSEDPVILDAPEGAEITFTESLDVMSGGAPPIHRGRMIGSVTIRRQNSKKANQSLSIRTANVGIDNRKIWTTESIDMKIGQARMVGRDLTVHFSGPAAASGDAETVLDRMELIYLDQLVMPLEKGGLTKARRDETAQLSVRCGGRLEYDFAIDQLSLRESVSLLHQMEGSPPDFFQCDTLLLKLLDPTNDSLPRDGPLDWLVSIVAKGMPARAVLPTFDAAIDADVIEFDAVNGLVRANGQTRTRAVRVRRGGVVATLSQLAYQFDPKNPEAIGLIDVRGAGIVNINDPEIPVLQAKWRDGFKLQPTSVTTAEDFNSDVELIVDGDIYARLSDGGEFRAETIAGILKPRHQIDPETGEKEMTLVPERVQATGPVRIDTSALAAQTDSLMLFFVDPIDAAAPRKSTGKKNPNPLRQWVSQPNGSGSSVAPVARPRPVIRGDSITAQLRLDSEGVSARDMSVVGDINVTHLMKAGGQILPAKLTGERLRLIDDGGGEDVLQLESGSTTPARFELGDGFFVGPMIQIRPNDNRIWMDAAGEFRIPTAALPTKLAGQEESQFRWISAPHCRWNGEMVFNGRTAVLTGGVEIKAALADKAETWDLHMHGDRLQVDLHQDVEVRDVDSMKNAGIQRVSLIESAERPVYVQAMRRAGDGVLEAKHLLHAAMISLTPGEGDTQTDSLAAGKLHAQGRGWYRGWMIPNQKKPLLPIGKPKSGEDASDKLTGIHLIFNDSMQGDFQARKLQFLRGVRVGVRSVDDWENHFDAANMDAISMGDSTLDCDRLQFTVAPGYDGRLGETPTPWEMEAISGVVFRTRNEQGLLEGTASRAAYASAKDLFTVDGAPNRAAIFRQTLPNGEKGHEGAVKTMTLRPSTMEVQNMQWERLNFATPPLDRTR